MRVRTDLYDCACGDPEWSDADNARDAENWATDQRRPDETPRVVIAVTAIRDGSGALVATTGREKTDEIAAIAAQVPGAVVRPRAVSGDWSLAVGSSPWRSTSGPTRSTAATFPSNPGVHRSGSGRIKIEILIYF